MSKLAPVVRVNYVVVGLDKVLSHHLDKRPTVELWCDSDCHRPCISKLAPSVYPRKLRRTIFLLEGAALRRRDRALASGVSGLDGCGQHRNPLYFYNTCDGDGQS